MLTASASALRSARALIDDVLRANPEDVLLTDPQVTQLVAEIANALEPFSPEA